MQITASPQGTFGVSGKQNSLFLLGPVITFLFFSMLLFILSVFYFVIAWNVIYLRFFLTQIQ